VSIVVLALYLLPLYTEGFAWWGEGARRFLGVSVMDFPRLRVHLALALEWPDFQLPRMSIQFAVGALLIVVQLLLRWGKQAVWHVAMHLHMDPQPGLKESRVLRVLAWSSWAPARYPTEVVQAALGAVDLCKSVTQLQAWWQQEDEEEEEEEQDYVSEDEDEEDVPRRRRPPSSEEEDEEEDAPRRRVVDSDEDEDDTPARRRPPSSDEDEEQEEQEEYVEIDSGSDEDADV
jgi:hypothetical protein